MNFHEISRWSFIKIYRLVPNLAKIQKDGGHFARAFACVLNITL
jgi:hypothetical protein